MSFELSAVSLRHGLEFLDYSEVFAGVFCDGFGSGFGIHEVSSDAEGKGPGFEEVFGGGDRNAAGGDELDLGERGFDALEVGGSAHCRRREDLDDVGSGLPGGDDLGGGEGAGKRGDGVAVAHFYSP